MMCNMSLKITAAVIRKFTPTIIFGLVIVGLMYVKLLESDKGKIFSGLIIGMLYVPLQVTLSAMPRRSR